MMALLMLANSLNFMFFCEIKFLISSGIFRDGGETNRKVMFLYKVRILAKLWTVRPCFKSPTIVIVSPLTVPISSLGENLISKEDFWIMNEKCIKKFAKIKSRGQFNLGNFLHLLFFEKNICKKPIDSKITPSIFHLKI